MIPFNFMYILMFLESSPSKFCSITFRDDAEWQVAVLSFLFLVIGMGNIITTTWTMTAKIRDRQKGYFKFRFTRLDKYFWTHKRRGPESRIVKVRLLLLLTTLYHLVTFLWKLK